MDWKTARFQDFLTLDRQLDALLPDAYREGTHLALLFAILHSTVIRGAHHKKSQHSFNEMSAFRFMRDHRDLPLAPETILLLYGAMLDQTEPAEWKQKNAYLEIGDQFYVTLPAEETPEAMETLCSQYAFLNDPEPDRFDEIFKLILDFICIHPFEDGNGRMSALLLQFLLQKAGLKCAAYLPVDLVQNGILMDRTSLQIRKASGVFYGMKPLEYGPYIAYMKDMLAKCYQLMLCAANKYIGITNI